MTSIDEPLIELGGNENPLGPSPRVREAIVGELDRLHRYPASDDALRTALAAHHGRGLTAAHFVTAGSGSEIIELISRAFLERGDQIILSTPTFVVYAPMAEVQGAAIVDVPLDPHDFSLDVGGLLSAVTPRTRLLYVCNPGNPTGALAPSGDLRRLLNQLPAHVTVVSDEVYADYVDDPDFPDTTAAILAADRVIVIRSFSKVFGLAGLRLGYAIAAPPIVQRLARLLRPYHLGRLALVAGIAALEDTEHMRRTIELARRGRRVLHDELSALGVEVWKSHANFVMVRPQDGEAMLKTLAARGIRARSTLKNGLPGAIRVTAGLDSENDRFLDVFAQALGRTRDRSAAR
jgi:histidinol-phosphate aminotransferase